MPRLLSPRWVMNIPWHTRQRKLKLGRAKRVRRKERNWKKPVKRQSWSSSMTCINTCLASAAGHGSKELMMSCGLLVYVYTWHGVLSMKKKVLVVSALYRSRAIDQYLLVRFAGGCSVFLHAFLSCLFRVADRHMLLVSCPSELHPRKERSSAISKWCSFDNSRKERHNACEIHIYAFLRCDSSEWQVTASGFSLARLSWRDRCALPVSICSSFSFSLCGGLLFSF